MLDFFTIFSKGGILLWCFNEIGLAEKELKGFTPAVNTFIKTVLLQVKQFNLNLTFFIFWADS
jgi:signal recognition particle receptor subunit alpha